uniref:Uncharacterized protein n=1 Tax=Cacopsylla melanoneura TaxID=428564 RepID=A0A8D9A8X0_9HEMI
MQTISKWRERMCPHSSNIGLIKISSCSLSTYSSMTQPHFVLSSIHIPRMYHFTSREILFILIVHSFQWFDHLTFGYIHFLGPITHAHFPVEIGSRSTSELDGFAKNTTVVLKTEI